MQDLNDKVNNGGATAAGQLSANEWNQIPSEIQNAIVSAGLPLSGSDLSQLIKSISQYSTVGNFFTGAGIANAYTASAVAPAIAPPALKDGMSIRFIVPASNTGASTLNAFSHGVVDIKLAGGITNPPAGALTIGEEKKLTYRTTPGIHWELQFVESFGVTSGTIIDFAGPIAFIPAGYLHCDGSEISKTTYADLFAAIGTQWDTTGGVAAPAAGNFRLPPSAIGTYGVFRRAAFNVGVGVYEADNMRAHVHVLNNAGNATGGGNPGLRTSPSAIQSAPTGLDETKPHSIATLMIIKF